MTELRSTPLDTALRHYEQELKLFEESGVPSPQQGLALLVARDAVQTVLVNSIPISADNLIKLEQLDQQLNKHTNAIAQFPNFANYRKLINPPETAWWWFPTVDQPTPWWDRFDGVYNVATIAFMTTSIALILNTSSRFFVGGADAWGSLAIVSQSVLALITGGSLTEKGREFLEHMFTGLKIPKRYWQEMNTALSLALLLVILGFRATLPQIAKGFNHNGETDYLAGRLDSALTHYQQAIALRPDYTEAHYNLGQLYEDLQKFDQAIAEYQLVVQSDPDSIDRVTLLKANNNLGHLYLVKGDADKAFPHLERGKSLVTMDAVNTNANLRFEYYSVLKNLGWLRLQQKRYAEADALLQEAIALDNRRASAYCLQAQVFATQKQPKPEWVSWEKCKQYARSSNPDEDQWIGLANAAFERLAKEGITP